MCCKIFLEVKTSSPFIRFTMRSRIHSFVHSNFTLVPKGSLSSIVSDAKLAPHRRPWSLLFAQQQRERLTGKFGLKTRAGSGFDGAEPDTLEHRAGSGCAGALGVGRSEKRVVWRDFDGDPEGRRKGVGVLQEKDGKHKSQGQEFYEFPRSSSSPQRATEPRPHNSHLHRHGRGPCSRTCLQVSAMWVDGRSSQEGSDGDRGRVGFAQTRYSPPRRIQSPPHRALPSITFSPLSLKSLF